MSCTFCGVLLCLTAGEKYDDVCFDEALALVQVARLLLTAGMIISCCSCVEDDGSIARECTWLASLREKCKVASAERKVQKGKRRL